METPRPRGTRPFVLTSIFARSKKPSTSAAAVDCDRDSDAVARPQPGSTRRAASDSEMASGPQARCCHWGEPQPGDRLRRSGAQAPTCLRGDASPTAPTAVGLFPYVLGRARLFALARKGIARAQRAGTQVRRPPRAECVPPRPAGSGAHVRMLLT